MRACVHGYTELNLPLHARSISNVLILYTIVRCVSEHYIKAIRWSGLIGKSCAIMRLISVRWCAMTRFCEAWEEAQIGKPDVVEPFTSAGAN